MVNQTKQFQPMPKMTIALMFWWPKTKMFKFPTVDLRAIKCAQIDAKQTWTSEPTKRVRQRSTVCLQQKRIATHPLSLTNVDLSLPQVVRTYTGDAIVPDQADTNTPHTLHNKLFTRLRTNEQTFNHFRSQHIASHATSCYNMQNMVNHLPNHTKTTPQHWPDSFKDARNSTQTH